MENNSITQKLKNHSTDKYLLAEKYYSILSAVNNLKLTQREIQLVAFTAIKGNISYANIREEFCAKYSSSGPTINNLISKLKRMKIFIKDGSKIKINPIISLAFDNDVVLQITITHG